MVAASVICSKIPASVSAFFAIFPMGVDSTSPISSVTPSWAKEARPVISLGFPACTANTGNMLDQVFLLGHITLYRFEFIRSAGNKQIASSAVVIWV